jgi:hypothetical protein
VAIHEAVKHHGTHDFYTGERLDWSLISAYDNEASKAGRAFHKAQFALLPTADHILRHDGRWDFAICAWRTNDAKNDLTYDDFVALCRRAVAKVGA